MSTVWLHTHLPRLRSGDPNPISVKVPGQRVDYASWVSVKNAQFKVHEKGRLRCLAEGVRNVHAWVVGTELLRIASQHEWSADAGYRPSGYRKAVYDPFRGGTFVDSVTLEPVHQADLVIMSGKDVFYADLLVLGRFL